MTVTSVHSTTALAQQSQLVTHARLVTGKTPKFVQVSNLNSVTMITDTESVGCNTLKKIMCRPIRKKYSTFTIQFFIII